MFGSKSNWAAIRSFEINPVRIENLKFEVEGDDQGKALFAFDKSLGTSFVNNDALSFGIPDKATACTLLLKLNKPGDAVNLLQFSTDGKLITESTIHTPFVQVNLTKDIAKLKIEGKVEIFEIIFE